VKLDGKVAVITGTSSNIGSGIAEVMASEGATIVCVDINPENAADCAAAIEKAGGRAVAMSCDVTDEKQVKTVVTRACETYRGIDILVNGAAIFNQKGVLDMPLAEWERQIAIILTGTFLFTKYVAQSMIEQRRPGSMINIISSAGHQGQPNNVAYCTSKCGLLNFTRSVAMELVPYGIRVNSLTPTATDPSEGLERAIPQTDTDAEIAQPAPLWVRRGVSRLGRLGDDDWDGPASGRWHRGALLGMGSRGGDKVIT